MAKKTKREVTIETLTKARALLAKRGGWTKGALARVGVKGPSVWDQDDKANSFCIVGALRRAEGIDRDFDLGARQAIVSLIPGEFDGVIPSFNDHRTTRKADVLGVLDQAIAKVQAKGQRVSK